MKQLVDLLIKNKITISSVESFTVGKFASTLGAIPGVSMVYKGSLVTYQNQTKERLLNIPSADLEKYGAISKEIASMMCVYGKQIIGSELCVSFTGNAGPEPMEGKPVGTIYIGIIYQQKVRVYHLSLDGSRGSIQEEAIVFACKKIKELIEGNEN